MTVNSLLQTFTTDISEEFLDFIEDGALSVEVWGHRRSGFPDMISPSLASEESEQRREKSFPEK